jgi:hypothetical protein
MRKSRTHQNEKTEDLSPLYSIDQKLLEGRGRSFNALLVQCACDEHVHTLKDTSTPRKGGKSAFSIIATCCSNKSGYLTPTMPALEAVFKVIMAHENKSISIAEISRGLVAAGVNSSGLRDLSPQTLMRIIEGDDYYGFSKKLPESKMASKD